MELQRLNIAGIVEDSITDGPGLRFSLFVQGCPHHCVGCHNPQTHKFGVGTDMSVDEIYAQLSANPLQSGVTFSGGEPFCQAAALAELGRRIKAAGYDLAAYSGFTFEELIADKSSPKYELLTLLDTLVDGKFVLEKRDLLLLFRGSGNQRIIDVPKSLASGSVVQREEWA